MKARRKGWTIPQLALGTACAGLGVAIAVLGFIDIYLTVTHLLAAWWGAWSWTVVVLGEGSFAAFYCGWLLLVLRDSPPKRIRVFLGAYLALFAAGSAALNLDAARGSFPGMVSHGVVVAAFFGYLLFAKVLVRRLSADPAAVEAEAAVAEARLHALDLVRARLGVLWRLRAPLMLRRQLTSGRFPAVVLRAVEDSARFGRAGDWEDAVGKWIGDALAVTQKAAAAAEDASRAIARRASPGPAGAVPAAVAESLPATVPVPSGESPGKAPRAAGVKPAVSALEQARKAKKAGRRIQDDDVLREAVRELREELRAAGKPLTVFAVMRDLPAGEPKARRLLEHAQAERRTLTVAK